MEKINRKYIVRLRYVVQWAVVLLTAYGGVRLWLFTMHFIEGREPYVGKSPLVDGFLPIGALMGTKLLLFGRYLDPIHPAAVVIFIAAVLMAVLLKKSFCGWICPVGTISEAVSRTGRRIVGRNFTPPRWVDYPLRSIKYILLGFFLWVTMEMPAPAIKRFLEGAYWKVADVKMMLFFTDMSLLTGIVLGGLFIGTLFIRSFWCRYLCPYGGFLGVLSYASPLKIKRNEDACIHCSACTRSCPSAIDVEKKETVRSTECMGCLSCVANCPAKGALDVSAPTGRRLHPLGFVAMVLVLFFGLVLFAQVSGNWKSNVSYAEYERLVPTAPRLDHP